MLLCVFDLIRIVCVSKKINKGIGPPKKYFKKIVGLAPGAYYVKLEPVGAPRWLPSSG
jgi:hypothetical protein